jgi:hypothetical protein
LLEFRIRNGIHFNSFKIFVRNEKVFRLIA